MSLTGGGGPITRYLSDNSRIDAFGSNFYFNASFYFRRFQIRITLDDNYELRFQDVSPDTPKIKKFVINHNAFKSVSTYGYLPFNIFKPGLALCYYPKFFGNSYLSNQLRLVAFARPELDRFKKYDPVHETLIFRNKKHPKDVDTLKINYDSVVIKKELQQNIYLFYGGFITNPKWNPNIPRTVLLVDWVFKLPSYTYDTDAGKYIKDTLNKTINMNYGISTYIALHDFRRNQFLKTIYLQSTFVHHNNGMAKDSTIIKYNSQEYGLILEFRYGLKSNSSFLVYANYEPLDNSPLSEDRNIAGFHFGIFFNFPITNHVFKSYYH